MKKIDKISRIIKGEEVNTIASTFWRHFYNFENDVKLLLDALISFQKKYKWDFVKINTRASYHIEGWGCFYDYFKNSKPKRLTYPIKKVSDWKKINPLKLSEPVLQEHLKLAEIIKGEFKDEVPVIFTIFLPIEIAARICGNRFLFKQYLNDYPEYIERALENIIVTFSQFAKEIIKRGIDGIFLATKCAEQNYLSEEEFRKWHINYDKKFLDVIDLKDKILILHVCGKEIRLNEMLDYEVKILHWDSTDSSNPALEEIYNKAISKVIMGGISNKQMQELSVKANLINIENIMLKKRWILSAECVLEPPFNEELLTVISGML